MLIRKEFGPYSTIKEFEKVKKMVDSEDEHLSRLGYVLFSTEICKTQNGSLIVRSYSKLSASLCRYLHMA